MKSNSYLLYITISVLYIIIFLEGRFLFSLYCQEGYRHGYHRFDVASGSWYWGPGYRDCKFNNKGANNDLETKMMKYRSILQEKDADIKKLQKIMSMPIRRRNPRRPPHQILNRIQS
jgi:hypothetical protein